MSDLIDRQAAIDAFADWFNGTEYTIMELTFSECKSVIKSLPSAQPEIIRCKDCKWWDKTEDSPFGYCMAMKHGYMSTNWEIGIYRRYKGDFYCADAEPKGEQE